MRSLNEVFKWPDISRGGLFKLWNISILYLVWEWAYVTIFLGAMSYKAIVSRDNFTKRIPQIRTLLLANIFTLKEVSYQHIYKKIRSGTCLFPPQRMFPANWRETHHKPAALIPLCPLHLLNLVGISLPHTRYLFIICLSVVSVIQRKLAY